jgi:hypothetical protein
MRNAQNPDHASLNGIINRLREGRFVIPDFQREFEWDPWDIRDLMRSIFLDYYIGNLLLWKGKTTNFEGLSCEPIYGFNGKSHPEHIVLDGQQRLTAMYYAFFGPEKRLPNRSSRAVFYLDVAKFMDDQDRDGAFGYDFWSRRMKKLLEHPESQYELHFFPMTVMGDGGWALPNWVQGYQRFWEQRAREMTASGDERGAAEARSHAFNAVSFGEHVKGISEEYQISYIELDEELPIDKVCDIFTQLNSKGVRLDVFDLMNALLKPKGVQLKHMWRDASERLQFVDTAKMNVYILQVMSILIQDYCSPKYLYYMIPGQQKQIREPDGTRRSIVLVQSEAQFNAAWQAAVDYLEKAVKLLRHPQEFGAISSRYLPYESIVPVFAAILAHHDNLPPGLKLAGRKKLQQWYWASVFLNRYSGSVESTSTRDYLDVTAWLDGRQDAPPLIAEFKARIPVLDLRGQTRSGTSIYNGIFNLLVLGGARDWITGSAPQHDDLHDHHIVPSSWGSDHLEGPLAHSILNRTPLTGKTNSTVIRDRLPNQYLPELMESNGENAVRSVLESHYISPAAFHILLRDPFGPNDFDEFITERQRTIQAAIEVLLIKERLDLPPDLRKLDQEIEATELALRQLIATNLDRDSERLPTHIASKIDERMQRAMRSDPAFDREHHATLAGALEFADLRELQDVISYKLLWPVFETTFGTKELLATRFNQLAEARNSIRHSRTLTDIARKDAEAAVIWFAAAMSERMAAD